jgi:hypothetical protein
VTPDFALLSPVFCTTVGEVMQLTRQEQFVICLVMGLLLMGLAVKVYRERHVNLDAPQPPVKAKF